VDRLQIRPAHVFRRVGAPFLALLLLQGNGTAAQAEPAREPGKLRCESREPTFDSREITCPLRVSESRQRFRLKVNFSGGHDDTSAAMAVSLDGRPLACEDGSKTRLMGEDGDVSLFCVFVVAPQAGAVPVLRATVSWSHAQYTDHDLAAD